MKKASLIILTLIGLIMSGGVAFFSAIALDISDGNYVDRLASIIASPSLSGGELWALKLCRWFFILGAQLPYAEIAACALGLAGLIVYLVRGPRSPAATLLLLAFLLPLLVVAPLLVAAPLSSSLTRREGAADFAFIGSYLLVVWVLLSGLAFFSASSNVRAERG